MLSSTKRRERKLTVVSDNLNSSMMNSIRQSIGGEEVLTTIIDKEVIHTNIKSKVAEEVVDHTRMKVVGMGYTHLQNKMRATMKITIKREGISNKNGKGRNLTLINTTVRVHNRNHTKVVVVITRVVKEPQL